MVTSGVRREDAPPGKRGAKAQLPAAAERFLRLLVVAVRLVDLRLLLLALRVSLLRVLALRVPVFRVLALRVEALVVRRLVSDEDLRFVLSERLREAVVSRLEERRAEALRVVARRAVPLPGFARQKALTRTPSLRVNAFT